MKVLTSLLLISLLVFASCQSIEESFENNEASPSEENAEWTSIPWSEASENSEILDLLDYGFDFSISVAQSEGWIADTEFHITEVLSLTAQDVDGTNYDFDIAISNDEGETAMLDFLIYDNPSADVAELLEFTLYDIQNV